MVHVHVLFLCERRERLYLVGVGVPTTRLKDSVQPARHIVKFLYNRNYTISTYEFRQVFLHKAEHMLILKVKIQIVKLTSLCM